MRLFVAVWPAPAAVAHLAETMNALPNSGGVLHVAEPQRWHVTLAFLGDVDEARTTAVRARLARVAERSSGGELRLAGAGRFGSSVLWIRVTGATDALSRLAERSAAAARRAGVSVEDRRFRAHLTVARGVPGVDLRPWVDRLAGYAGPAWRLDQITLVRSRLGAQPAYDVLDSWPLDVER
jgi:RNA 2',3'-cyclic 3'-phosphodiesterase